MLSSTLYYVPGFQTYNPNQKNRSARDISYLWQKSLSFYYRLGNSILYILCTQKSWILIWLLAPNILIWLWDDGPLAMQIQMFFSSNLFAHVCAMVHESPSWWCLFPFLNLKMSLSQPIQMFYPVSTFIANMVSWVCMVVILYYCRSQILC